MGVARQRRPNRLLLLAGAAAVFLLLRYRSSRGGGTDDDDDTAAAGQGAPCPLVYRRLALDAIRRGDATPYLLGGPQQPRCRNCKRRDGWAGVCQFVSGETCSAGVRAELLAAWLKRSHELALTLTPCDLWPHLAGRTLWLVGDSMMLDFYKASQCFMYEFWPELAPRNASAGDATLQARLSTVLPATCAHLLGGTRICYIRADKGEDLTERVLPLMPRLAAPTDLLVVNFGLHHWKDYGQRLGEFAAYWRQHRTALPRLLWQQTSQQHFVNGAGSGEYPGGDPPFKCGAIANFSVAGDGVVQLEAGRRDSYHMLTGNWRNTEADRAVRQAGIPILPSYNETLWMWGMHRDNGAGLECTHFCHPSAPQTWVIALYRELSAQAGLAADGGGGSGGSGGSSDSKI